MKIKRKQLGTLPHSGLDAIEGGTVHLTSTEYADFIALRGGSSIGREPVSVWNNGSPEIVFNGIGEVVMSDAS